MSSPFPLIVVAVAAFTCVLLPIALVPAGLYFLVRRRERQRSDPLSRVARDLGLAFAPGRRPVPPGLLELPLFNQGRSRKAYNVMRGQVGGTEVALLDYAFLKAAGGSIAGGRRTAFAPYQVAAFRLDDGASPDLDAPRSHARSAVFLIEAEAGWIAVARSGFSPPETVRSFVEDADRILAMAVPDQGRRALEALWRMRVAACRTA